MCADAKVFMLMFMHEMCDVSVVRSSDRNLISDRQAQDLRSSGSTATGVRGLRLSV